LVVGYTKIHRGVEEAARRGGGGGDVTGRAGNGGGGGSKQVGLEAKEVRTEMGVGLCAINDGDGGTAKSARTKNMSVNCYKSSTRCC